MAGPWFTVHRSGDDWKTVSKLWISNGEEDGPGQIQVRIELEDPGDER